MQIFASDNPPLYSTRIGDQVLAFYQDQICFGNTCLPFEEIDGLLAVRTDTYVNGAWVKGERKVRLRANADVLEIDCSRFLPSRDQLNSVFVDVMAPVMETIGERLTKRFLSQIASGDILTIGGTEISRDGVWVDGNWKFLWWQAKPRFVPWEDLKLWSDEGVLFLSSRSDLRFQRQIEFNKHENALILDRMIRQLFDGQNLKAFKDWRPR